METFFEFVDQIEQYSITTWVLLVAMAIILSSFLKRDKESPQFLGFSLRERIHWRTFLIGLLLLFSAQTLKLVNKDSVKPLSPSEVLKRLKNNTRVKMLARIIPHDDQNAHALSIENLQTLGKPTDEYVFVADYEEIRGHTIKDAIYKMGGQAHLPYASIVIFPLSPNVLPNRYLLPANCRGVLQAVREIDKNHRSDPNYTPFPWNGLSEGEKEDLTVFGISSWEWDNYREHFSSFRKQVERFRDKTRPYSAREHIGNINKDWHPVGVATVISEDRHLHNKFTLKGTDEDLEIDNLGVRVFLFPNLKMSEIKGKVLMKVEIKEGIKVPSIE